MDDISLERAQTLHPVIRSDALGWLNHCYEEEIPVRITAAMRSFEEQENLYDQGRKNGQPIVTNAKAGYSWHNYGLAFDFVILIDNGKGVSWKVDSKWKRAAAIATEVYGFEWGGNWDDFKDYPHFQKKFDNTIEIAIHTYQNQIVDENGYILLDMKI